MPAPRREQPDEQYASGHRADRRAPSWSRPRRCVTTSTRRPRCTPTASVSTRSRPRSSRRSWRTTHGVGPLHLRRLMPADAGRDPRLLRRGPERGLIGLDRAAPPCRGAEDPRRRAILTHDRTVTYGELVGRPPNGPPPPLRRGGCHAGSRVADDEADAVVALLAAASAVGAEATLLPARRADDGRTSCCASASTTRSSSTDRDDLERRAIVRLPTTGTTGAATPTRPSHLPHVRTWC